VDDCEAWELKVSHDDSFYDDLPEDPEQAFLYLESKFRAECDTESTNQRQNVGSVVDTVYIKYISSVAAAIKELELKCEIKMPMLSANSNSYTAYLEFRRDVDQYRTMLSIRHSRRRKEYTVALDQPTKLKLRHLLTQMKEVVDKLGPVIN
jgi:hypothetical protein